MADVQWIKLATYIFDNRKIKQIERMPEGDSIIVVWFKLLCLAGTCNNNGMIYLTEEIPYTEEMLATEFNMQNRIMTLKLALKTFIQFGMIQIIDDIFYISSWEKYQNVNGLEKIREQNRIRKQKQREKEKLLECHVTSHDNVTHCHATDKELDKDKDKEVDIKNNKYMCAFEELWNVYPRKKEKAKAYKCYQARLNDGYSEIELLNATKAYDNECKKNKTEEKFIKLAATFLGPNTPFLDYIRTEVTNSAKGNGSDKANESDPCDIFSLVQRGKQNMPDM